MTEEEFYNEIERLDGRYKDAMNLEPARFSEVNDGISKRIIALHLAFMKERNIELDVDNLDDIVIHKSNAYNELRKIDKKYKKRLAEDGVDIDRVSKEYARVRSEAVKNSDFMLSIRGSDGKIRRFTATHYTNIFVDAVKGREEINNVINDSISTGRSSDVQSTILKIPSRGSTDACKGYEGKYVSADGSKKGAIINGKEEKLYSLPALLANRRDIFHPFCRHYGMIAVSDVQFV